MTDDEITVAPDGKPMEEQPRWRKDFAIDWPQDQYIARRELTKFLVLISSAFAAGQAWIAAHTLVQRRRPPPEKKRIASLATLAPGSSLAFDFPGEHDSCVLVRTRAGSLRAYSQKCTHLSCAVVPKVDEGVLHCPCHEGYFDLETGRKLAGPPPRPLPKIELEVSGDEVYAVSVTRRNV